MAKIITNKPTTTTYTGENLNYIAFPLGGMGAGMICIEGNGSFSHVSLKHHPDIFNEPLMFAALYIKGAKTARVLEGPVPMRKAFGLPGSGNGRSGALHYGLPRFEKATFTSKFPFAEIDLTDRTMPVNVEITAWSPFIPGDADNSSLPVAGIEYTLKNRTSKSISGVFSFHLAEFLSDTKGGRRSLCEAIENGFILRTCGKEVSPYVGSWKISKLFDSDQGIEKANPVSMCDNIGWQDAVVKDFFVDVRSSYKVRKGYVYLATKVYVKNRGEWIFSIGHDDWMKLFIDGKHIHTSLECHYTVTPHTTQVPVQLMEGEHEIVIALRLDNGNALSLFFESKDPARKEYPTPDKWLKFQEGALAAFTDNSNAKVDCGWIKERWFDTLTMLWNKISSGTAIENLFLPKNRPCEGASLYVPFKLKGKAKTSIKVCLTWYVPESTICVGERTLPFSENCYKPWYASRFSDISEVCEFWRRNYFQLRKRSLVFSNCFYDMTLPAYVIDAVASNLTILKSPTVLRQHDGRLWGWEGCSDKSGCCYGSCTHVWNYAQAICHLFPSLERTLRETEFFISQDERGHQAFRTPLPIDSPIHNFHAAADGQLGGIIKVYREWRISGDNEWLKKIWNKVKESLDYCIATWDPDHTGMLIEPHHNTYDIEFWGPDGMCTSFYLSALQAAIQMGKFLKEDVSLYQKILSAGKKAIETEIWNGSYFYQKVCWKNLRSQSPDKLQPADYSSPELLEILEKEGPKYQYGTGCLSDGMIGDWLARVCGLPTVIDEEKVRKHLLAVFKNNFKVSLRDHANPQRYGYALGQEGGLILCSWPNGNKPSFPFPYSDEVWTGIEYEVASHLIMLGCIKEGLKIVEVARKRYDGRYRNPFNEYECGHWYARAMSSYSLLQALSGARYDAVEKVMYIKPPIKGDYKVFISTATGFGSVGIKNGKPFLKVVSGKIEVKKFLFI